MGRAWIYILRCADGTYHTGHTSNLQKRLAEHEAGEGSTWTQKRLPVELVYQQEMADENKAFLAERQIKNWSRAKKAALIAGEWNAVRWFAKKPRLRE